MKLMDRLRLKGRVRVTVRDARTRKVLETQVVENLIVTAGKNQVADLLAGVNTNSFTHCGVGSSAQAPAVGDIDLIMVIGSRKAATDRFRTNNIATFSTFFASADNNGTWRESGLFTALTGGVMLARALFASAITKDTTKTVTCDWDITCG